jgi:copper transport protein
VPARQYQAVAGETGGSAAGATIDPRGPMRPGTAGPTGPARSGVPASSDVAGTPPERVWQADPAGVRRLRRAVMIEVIGAILILGLTSALVQTTPARSALAGGANPPGQFDQTLTTSLYQVQVSVAPTKVGNVEVHLFAYTPQGAPMKILQWTATASMPAGGIEPIAIPLLAITDSHATGLVDIPTAGTWRFSFTLRTTEIDEATVTAAVPIT